MLLAFLIEPLIYGVGLDDFSTAEYITHWIVTCILWGVSAFLLRYFAKKRFGLDIFANKNNIHTLNWVLCFVCLAITVTISIIDYVVDRDIKVSGNIANVANVGHVRRNIINDIVK